MAERSKKWTAADGSEHDSKKEAVYHEKLSQVADELARADFAEAEVIDAAAEVVAWFNDRFVLKPRKQEASE